MKAHGQGIVASVRSAIVKKDYLALLGISLALNLLILRLFCCTDVDGIEYFRLAVNLAAGKGLSLSLSEPFLPAAFRGPLYPAVLALFIKLFGTYTHIFIFQAITNTLTIFIVYKIIRRLVPDANPGITIFCLLLFSLQLISYAPSLSTEAVNAFLGVMAFYLLLRKDIFYAGLVFGLAVLCRPENLFILLLVVVCIRKPRQALTLIASALLLVAPWMVRNYRALGAVNDPALTACNLIAGTSPAFWTDPLYLEAFRHMRGYSSQEERDSYLTRARRVYFERWSAQPLQLFAFKLKALGRALLYSLEGFIWGTENPWSFHSANRSWPLLIIRGLVILLYGPVFFGLVIAGLWRHFRRETIFLAIPFVVMVSIGIVAYVDHRHLMFARVLLIPLFVIGLMDFLKRRSLISTQSTTNA
ncbi:MAG TPA: glycosyltransferase family 39 protein [Pyrinomonadaceae bacterium]|jgi:hypothetical protein|nr:glycosyltransferase family 39 protein [Pyrinomonadaceae bacterium]